MKLRIGYLMSGVITGIALVLSIIFTLPDGKLHIFFCDVGQGDSAYVRFPNGKDMLVDGGPNDKVLLCLGRHMPFWDRHIDMVVLTHPQKDHMQGLISVLDRYKVDFFVRPQVSHTSDGYGMLINKLQENRIPVRFPQAGDFIRIGATTLSFVWPSQTQLAQAVTDLNVLGSSTVSDLNDFSLVFLLRFGSFDTVFTGDADTRVSDGYVGTTLGDENVEVLKVPHHGSRTGMDTAFVGWIHPDAAVVSVGKNSYGHPTAEALELLKRAGAQVHRTDQEGDVEVVSDGKEWNVFSEKKQK